MEQEIIRRERRQMVMGGRKKGGPLEYDNLFFCLVIIFPSAVSLFTQTARMFISTRSLDTLLMYGLMAIVTIKILPKLKYVTTIRELILLFGFTLAFLLSTLNPIANMQLMRSVLMEILTRGVFVYFGAKLVHESSVLNLYLRISSCILLLRVVATTYIFNTSTLLTVGYSQADGYYLLTGMGLLLLPLITEHKLFDIIIAIITLLITLLTGARGPFLFSVLMVIISVFISNYGKKRNAIRYVIPAMLVILAYQYMREILVFISSFVGNSSSLRTIDRLLNNELFQDSKRITQYGIAWDYIKEHWLWGSGVVNDRIVMNKAMPSLGDVAGSYPHNLFLEIGMQFGLVMGIVIVIILLATITNTFKKAFSLREKLLVLSLIMVGFVPLMVSGSYLSYTMFFGLLGYCNRRPYTFGTVEDT